MKSAPNKTFAFRSSYKEPQKSMGVKERRDSFEIAANFIVASACKFELLKPFERGRSGQMHGYDWERRCFWIPRQSKLKLPLKDGFYHQLSIL